MKERSPGAPIGKDEIDPELVSLRGPRAKVGVITAFAILVVCVFYLVKLFGDFSFSRASNQARDVTVDDVIHGNVGTDEVVQLASPLERSAAVRVRTGQGDPGVRVAPVVGSHDQLWVALPGDPWQPANDGKYRGRLHRAGSSPLGKALADYLEAPQPRFVPGAELARARGASATGGELTTVEGAKIKVDSGDVPVEIAVVDPGAARIVVTYIERLKTAKAWTDALIAAKVIDASSPDATPVESGDLGAAWIVHTSDAVAQTEAKLEKAELWASRVDPVTVSRKSTWKQLGVSASELTIGDAKLPWSAVDVAAVWIPRPLPDGTYVLVADEMPNDYKMVTPLFVVLGVIGLFFAWALWRAVRRDLMPLPK
ncbi:MAG TPA: hypothetical protein VL463_28405 [Kofleriaceae bacterium]|nr:hypothetical protein [Kofleriaceae bacterium]